MDNLHMVSWSRLKPVAFAYILLPIALFCSLWLRPAVGIPLTIITIAIWILAVQPRLLNRWRFSRKLIQTERPMVDDSLLSIRSDASCSSLRLSTRALALMALVALVWCVLGGQGCFWYQSPDWSARNAIYNDLITHSWPVYYNDGANALVYYLNHWLPPAALSHGLFLATGNASFCWRIGNILLLLWTASGVFLVELLIANLLHAENGKRLAFVVCLLVFFSGMDIVGVWALMARGSFEAYDLVFQNMYLEWWAQSYEFTSNTAQLFWVFNQAVIPWICTCCLLLSRDVRNYAVIVVACAAAGPFAAVGLAVFAVALGIKALVWSMHERVIAAWLKAVFSPQNILVLVPLAAYVAYFLCNSQSGNTSGGDASGVGLYLLFLFVEAGAYLLVLSLGYGKRLLFWVATVSLCAAPLVRIGTTNDFCARASIPALFCIMLMSGAFIMQSFGLSNDVGDNASDSGGLARQRRIAAIVLCACLALGAATPVFELARGVVTVEKVGIEEAQQPLDDIEGNELGSPTTKNVKMSVDPEAFYFKWLAGSD